MWPVAFYLGVFVLPIGIRVLLDSVRTLRLYHDFHAVAITVLWILSAALVIVCDVARVTEAVTANA
jgi:hypothetical protein